MPFVELIPVAPSFEGRSVERLKQRVFSVLTRCGCAAGFRRGGSEEQPITLLPSEIEYTESTVRIRIMTLARARDIFISAEERDLVVEARVQEQLQYASAGSTVYEKLQKRFTRSFDLPWRIDPSSVQAQLHGFELTVTAKRLIDRSF